MKKNNFLLMVMTLIVLLSILFPFAAFANTVMEDIPPEDGDSHIDVISPSFASNNSLLSNETPVVGYRIGGPPEPPPGYEEARVASLIKTPSRSTIADFPSYDWVFGCSAVSAAMIAAYYDRNGYPDIYTGPTNGGLMPITDTSWGTWVDDASHEYPNNPLVASHDFSDGRTGPGSIDNYWVSYMSTDDDPYITNGGPEHIWESAIGDFMKTSQSNYYNPDGSTWNWTYYSNSKLTCTSMESAYSSTYDNYVSNLDGTYGRKLFYEARGYTVGDCYNQNTDNTVEGGFSLADFKAEIDAGNPVLLQIRNDFTDEGHSIVGFGYSGSTIYIRDTWDSNPNNIYSMAWGTSYAGMALKSVSIVHLSPIVTPPPIPTAVASDGVYTDKVRVSWLPSEGATSYEVYRNMSDSPVGRQRIASDHPVSPYDDITAAPGNLYYYWVRACITDSCSDFSIVNTGYRGFTPPTGVNATDGAFTDKVQVSWEPIMGATHYRIFRDDSDDPGAATELEPTPTFPPYDDSTALLGTTYYYWVMACNSLGCSDVSNYDTGYRASTISTPTPPADIFASDGTYKEKVRVTWPAVIGASHYEIYRNDNNTHTGEKPLTDSHTTNAYDDTNAEHGTTYYYWVKACNLAGCSAYSKYDSGYRAIEIPAVPEKVVASDGTYDDKVSVSWQESDRATYYEVYRNNINTNPILVEGNQLLPPYEDASAVIGMIYYYWIKACNSTGCSDYSSVDQGFRSTVIPPTPTYLSASDGTYTDKVQILWVGNNFAEFYQLYRNTSDSFGPKDLINGNIISSIYNDTSADPDIKYYYSVRACRAAGCSINYSVSDIGWRNVENPANQIYLPLIMGGSSAMLDSSIH